MNLPPRYVELCSERKNTRSKTKSKKRVNFDETANTVTVLPRTNGSDTWYTNSDYIFFFESTLVERQGDLTPTTATMNYLISQGQATRGLLPSPKSRRGKLIASILSHQDACRREGFTDPEGYCFLSQTLSRQSRSYAHETAAWNAHEVECFRKEDANSDLMTALVDSLYPYMQIPLSTMSKILLCGSD